MTPHQQVEHFNRKVGWGDGVIVRMDALREMVTTTRAMAQVLHDGRAVIWVDGHIGAVELHRVRPDGRKAQDIRRPEPERRTRVKRKMELVPKVANT